MPSRDATTPITPALIRAAVEVHRQLEAALAAEYRSAKCPGCGRKKERSPGSIESQPFPHLCRRCFQAQPAAVRERLRTKTADGYALALADAIDHVRGVLFQEGTETVHEGHEEARRRSA